jgi:hypothetical protein
MQVLITGLPVCRAIGFQELGESIDNVLRLFGGDGSVDAQQ